MDIIGKAKDYFEQRGRPYSKEQARAGVIPLEEQGSVNRVTDTDRLYQLLRKSPEVISLVQAVVDDIIGNGYRFEYLGDSSGERARKNARNFYEREVKEAFADAIFDSLMAGDGYLYKNMLTESEVRNHILSEYGSNFNMMDNSVTAANAVTNEIRNETELLQKPKSVQMVPASTVEHEINQYGDIKNFHQEIDGGPQTDIPPEKMIHLPYLNLNGGTYNFTPMRAIVSELQILANSKDHNGKIHENAAIVNKLFNLPDDGPESENYKHLYKTVKQFRKLENKHRDLILTGNIEVEDLNSIGSEMQFRELAEYMTRVVVMAWGVPPTRIGMSISGESGARVTSMTHQGYFRRIKRMQDKWMNDLNQGLWEPHFNVRMHLDDPDVQTSIKEADRDLRETDVVMRRMAAGLMNKDAAMDYLGISPEETMDLESDEDQKIMERAAAIAGSSNSLSDRQVEGDRTSDEMAEDQKEVKKEADGE